MGDKDGKKIDPRLLDLLRRVRYDDTGKESEGNLPITADVLSKIRVPIMNCKHCKNTRREPKETYEHFQARFDLRPVQHGVANDANDDEKTREAEPQVKSSVSDGAELLPWTWRNERNEKIPYKKEDNDELNAWDGSGRNSPCSVVGGRFEVCQLKKAYPDGGHCQDPDCSGVRVNGAGTSHKDQCRRCGGGWRKSHVYEKDEIVQFSLTTGCQVCVGKGVIDGMMGNCPQCDGTGGKGYVRKVERSDIALTTEEARASAAAGSPRGSRRLLYGVRTGTTSVLLDSLMTEIEGNDMPTAAPV